MDYSQQQIRSVEQDLEQWVVAQSQAGVPVLVLVGVLRAAANDIEMCGYVPRSWVDAGEEERTA